MSLNKIKMIKKTYDKTPCEEEKDCAHLAYFIEEQLQEIKRIKFNSIQIQDCPALLRDNDILVITLPTLFSNFHYITVVYEKKLIYIFQNYGSYEIPMLIKTVNFFNMVKDKIIRVICLRGRDHFLTNEQSCHPCFWLIPETQGNLHPSQKIKGILKLKILIQRSENCLINLL